MMTSRFRAALSLSVVLLLGASPPVFSWTRTADFEQGKIGHVAEAPDGFDGAAGNSLYTDYISYSGDQAALLQAEEGKEGWGTFGGVIDFPEEVKAGGEVWIRFRAYFPSSYVFFDPPQINKFFRVRTKGPIHGTRYNNVYVNDYQMRYIRTAGDWKSIVQHGPARDEWHTYELYLSLDDVSLDNGGEGMMRFWIDGELVAEHTDVMPLAEPDATAYALYLFTWWGNGGPPKDVHLYVDDIVITTEPDAVDDQGHRYIGTARHSARPRAPTGVSYNKQ